MDSTKVLTLADVIADPDAVFEEARRRAAVVPTELGSLAVRYDAVRSILQDPRAKPTFSKLLEQVGVSSGPFHDWISMSPLDMEGEEHRQWRQLMLRTFTPRSVERLRPFLKAQAERLVGEFAERGRCEFIEDFARKLPALGLCELVGVPAEDRERFSVWADTIGLGFNIVLLPQRIADVDRALLELLDYVRGLVQTRRAAPRDDLVTRIAHATEEDGMDEESIHASIAGLVFAGHETTKNQLGWLVSVLSEVPQEWERVAREPSRAADVIEEVLRFRSTATNVGRIAREDLQLFGSTVPKDSLIVVSLWSANRDETKFANPNAFDVDANRNAAQIAFGQGAHHCLGAALARAELQESLLALTRRITCPKLEPGSEFLPPVGITGPSRLPISFSLR